MTLIYAIMVTLYGSFVVHVIYVCAVEIVLKYREMLKHFCWNAEVHNIDWKYEVIYTFYMVFSFLFIKEGYKIIVFSGFQMLASKMKGPNSINNRKFIAQKYGMVDSKIIFVNFSSLWSIRSTLIYFIALT